MTKPTQTRSAPSGRSVRDIPIYRTGMPLVGPTRRFNTDPLTFHLEPYRKLGSIYRMQLFHRQRVVLAGIEANDFVWRNNDLWRYSEQRRVWREGLSSTYLLQLDGEPHRKKRRRITPAFTFEALQATMPLMSRAFHAEMQTLPATPVDLRDLCSRLIICMIGQSLCQMDVTRERQAALTKLEFNVLIGNILGPLRSLWYRRPAFHRVKRDWIALIDQMLIERERSSSTDEDLLSLMLKAYPPSEPPISQEELAYDLFLLLEAGWETTAYLLLWTLMYVYHDPVWLEELRAEMQEHPPETLTHLSAWPKLNATVIEVERLRPPVPYNDLIPAHDFEYQGFRVPKSALILHASALTHFLPELYADPLDFKPQRFLDGAGCPAKAHATYGGGAHYCLGQPLARVLVQQALAHLLCDYQLVFETKPSFRFAMPGVIAPIERSLMARISRQGRSV